MMRVREHVYGLHLRYPVFFIKQGQVAGLRSRVAAHIHYGGRFDFKNFTDQLFVHAGTRRVGNDHIGATVLRKETVVAYVNHVAAGKVAVFDAVEQCVLAPRLQKMPMLPVPQ